MHEDTLFSINPIIYVFYLVLTQHKRYWYYLRITDSSTYTQLHLLK